MQSVNHVNTLIKKSNALRITDSERSLEIAGEAFTLAEDAGMIGEKIMCLLIMAVCLDRLGRYDEAKERLHTALHILEKHRDPVKENNARALLANIYMETGELKKARDLYLACAEHYRKSGHQLNKGVMFALIANVYTRLTDLDSALNYHFKSLKIFQDHKNLHSEASTTHNIAVVYSELGDLTHAIEFFNRSLKLFTEVGDQGFMANSLNGLANIYRKTKQFDKGLDFALQAIELNEAAGNTNGMTCALLTAGKICIELGQDKKALDFANKSLLLARKMKSPLFQAKALHCIGNLHASKKQHNQALNHLKNGLEYAEKIDSKKIKHKLHQKLSATYEATGDYLNALFHHKQFQKTKESVFNEESDKRIQMLKIRFETEQKENENRIYRLKIDQQRREMVALIRTMTEQNDLIQSMQDAMSQPVKSMSHLTLLVKERKELLKDSAEFHKQFNKAFPGFIDNLRQAYPSLTRQELNICAMIRLELTSQEIAKTLFITKRSVHWHRHQIRKKLGIDSQVDLGVFLKNH